MRRGKVLVLGDDTRAFLAIVRSLGRHRLEVHAAPANFQSPALKSRYIARAHFLPYWIEGNAEWLDATERLLKAERFDLVIPCNETTLLPIHLNRKRLQSLTKLAVPDERAIDALFDKHKTRELARSLDVPVAAGRLPRAGDSAQGVLDELGSPVVVKPRSSYSLQSLHSRGKVQVIDSAAVLAGLLPHLDPEYYLFEGFFPGRGLGVSVLASGGRILQAFEHHRVRENSSGSYYRVSAAVSQPLLEACTRIMAAVDYTGVAMFEFRRDEATGHAALLEVNARPWGSLPLPVGLGVDFPYRWYQLLTAGEETQPVAYKAGIYGRNLVLDLRASLSEARKLGGNLPRLVGFAASRTAELGRVISGREIHDVLVRDDVRPGLGDIADLFQDARLRLARMVPFHAQRGRARSMKALQAAFRLGRERGKISIVFVCEGNICRSPFAEAVLKRRLPLNSVAVSSAGMMPQAGRTTPQFGIDAARLHGIDLTRHHSAHLSRAQARAATAIFVFDDINVQSVLERYPRLRAPIVKLASFVEGVGDIHDPVDGDEAVFRRSYDTIETLVDRLAEIIERELGTIPARKEQAAE